MPAIWLDAHLPPASATWMASLFSMPVHPVRDLGLREADDTCIFARARREGAIIMSKDADFLLLLDRQGPPQRIIWLHCGNTTNAGLQSILSRHAPAICTWLAGTEPLLEIRAN